MNTTEMTDAQLNALVAEKVMGYRWFNQNGKNVLSNPNPAQLSYWMHAGVTKGRVEGCRDETEGRVPNYTADPAAALEVLKKCAERLDQLEDEMTIVKRGVFWTIKANNSWGERNYEVESDTLEKTILIFSIELFK